MWYPNCCYKPFPPNYNIIEDYKQPANGEGPFYTDYLWTAQTNREVGLEYINWNETKYTYLAEHKEDIISIFNQHYKYREIGAETYLRFQDILQIRFDEVCNKYDHAYKVHEENDVDKLGIGYTFNESRDRTITTEGSSTGNESRDNKYKDTPSSSTSTINNPTNETLDTRENTTSANTTETLKDTISQDKTQHDKEMVVELSELIDKYRQLDIEFVYQFENCFIGLIGVDM